MAEPTPCDPCITFSEIARNHAAKRVSTSAVWRWARKGVKARNGERVRLRHIRQGGTLLTTRTWFKEFCEALAAADTAHFDARTETGVNSSKPAPPSPHTGTRDWTDPAELAAAEAVLEKEGL